jgi:hypothetical protein
VANRLPMPVEATIVAHRNQSNRARTCAHNVPPKGGASGTPFGSRVSPMCSVPTVTICSDPTKAANPSEDRVNAADEILPFQ